MKKWAYALLLAALLAGCVTATKIRYESPTRQFEIDRTMDSDGRA